ncbi:hypothetical protein [Marinicella rhabdoformis]|uniref:hypothetical protein n=1 Tax=Marinicella rhabdoformis TaxID=2580566 RepID=UPI0012AEDFA0|nr:hypothetical protein [Marinicella rhabdoformis]
MIEVAQVDDVESRIVTFDEAQEVLACLPNGHPKLDIWHNWAQVQFKGKHWLAELIEVVTICYARMAMRNGSLSANPRAYHNERHINELLLRLVRCTQSQHSTHLSLTGLAILSVFAASHDLRQAEPSKDADDESLVGANEAASYIEVERLINQYPESTLWNSHRLMLLMTMIHASTFGTAGKRSTNFFQGNLSRRLLAQLRFTEQDEELVYLACDIDTANVSLPLNKYAKSAIKVFDELVSHQKAKIPPQQFFSQAQMAYFFDQQHFHSKTARSIFQPEKSRNAKRITAISKTIKDMDAQSSIEAVKNNFIQQAQTLSKPAPE